MPGWIEPRDEQSRDRAARHKRACSWIGKGHWYRGFVLARELVRGGTTKFKWRWFVYLPIAELGPDAYLAMAATRKACEVWIDEALASGRDLERCRLRVG